MVPAARAALRLLAAAALALAAARAGAVRPMVLHHDLIAGAGRAGYRDGTFAEALFSAPLGIAPSPDGTRIYVADLQNNRIRVVRLDQGSRVETLAGTGRAGCSDGPRAGATFDGPAAVALVSKGRLAVWDRGNAALRSVDLRTGAVTTIGGNGIGFEGEGPALSVPMSGVWSLAYDPASDALYYSQPEAHVLKRLDLETGIVETIVRDDRWLAAPAALCMFQGKLHVADRASGVVFRLEALPSGGKRAALKPLGTGTRVVALAGSGDRLYALQAGNDAPWLCVTTGKPVELASASGDLLRNAFDPKQPFLSVGDEPAGFAPDPRSDGAVIVAGRSANALFGLKDYDFGALVSTRSTRGGLGDFAYPKTKPALTYRLLMVGDSRDYFSETARYGWGEDMARMGALPKKLELLLNLHAALEDRPRRFEVLHRGDVSWNPVLVWPVTLAPELAASYDVDRVLLVLSPSAEDTLLTAYLDRPATPDGIPARDTDAEYLLSTVDEKIAKSPARRFFEICRESGKLKTRSETQAILVAKVSELAEDPALHEQAVELLRRPLRLLRQRLRSRAGAAVPLTVVFLPPPHREASDRSRDLWREVCGLETIDFVDLLEPFAAAREAFSPLGISGDGAHFNARGHDLLATVLAWRLEKLGLVPF